MRPKQTLKPANKNQNNGAWGVLCAFGRILAPLAALFILSGCVSLELHSFLKPLDKRVRIPQKFNVDRNSEDYKIILSGIIREHWMKRELERMEKEYEAKYGKE